KSLLVNSVTRHVGRRELLRAWIAREPLNRRDRAATKRSCLLLRARRPAMGSYFEICIPDVVPGALALAEKALDRVDDLESQMTIYRGESELSRINATAHLGPVTVEPRLFKLINQALVLGHETKGAYDVTSGALSIAWGFIRGPKLVPDP